MKAIRIFYLAIIIGSGVIHSSCGTNTEASQNDNEISSTDEILQKYRWVGLTDYTAHICTFDGKMYSYVINDVQGGSVRQDGKWTGEYSIEKNDNGSMYVTIQWRNKSKIFKIGKNSKGEYYLDGETKLFQDLN